MNLSGALIFVAFCFMYWVEGNPPAEYKEIRLNKQVYLPGDFLDIDVDVCKKKRIPFSIHARVTNGVTVHLEEIETIGMIGGGTTGNLRFFQVPKFIPEGEYQLKAWNEYRINFLRTRTIEWETPTFTVIR